MTIFAISDFVDLEQSYKCAYYFISKAIYRFFFPEVEGNEWILALFPFIIDNTLIPSFAPFKQAYFIFKDVFTYLFCLQYWVPFTTRGLLTAVAPLLWSTGSVIVAHSLSRVACVIFPDQGSNLCPWHCQGDS